jgi:hypothetical protein
LLGSACDVLGIKDNRRAGRSAKEIRPFQRRDHCSP